MRTYPILAMLAFLAVPFAAGAAIQGEQVTYRDGDVEMRGYLTWDDAVQGRRPGVLRQRAPRHQSRGGRARHREPQVRRQGGQALLRGGAALPEGTPRHALSAGETHPSH